MKILLMLFTFFILSNFSNGQDIPVPEGFILIDWYQDDLNQDGLIDMAAVYNPSFSDSSVIQQKELILYRWNGKNWVEWIRTKEALMPLQDEFDPYRGIEIENGVLTIRHAGKSDKIWQTLDEYQLIEGDFRLVRYTHTSFVLCDIFQMIGLNVLTGEGMVVITQDPCEEEKEREKIRETEEFTVDSLKIGLSNRYKDPIVFQTPKLKAELILSPKLNHE